MGFREPILLPAVAFAAGIVAHRLGPGPWQHCAWAAIAVTLLACVARRLRYAVLLVAIALAGAAWAGWREPASRPQLDTGGSEYTILSGCIVEPPVATPDRRTFVLELAPAARARVSLSVSATTAPPDLHYGDRVEFEARVREPRNFGNPGAFDYRGYLARSNIYWSATTQAADIKRLPEPCGLPIRRALSGAREWLLRRIEALFPDGQTSALLAALLVGESRHLERGFTDRFRDTGTYHALVISGLHVTVLASVLLAALRLALIGRWWAYLLTTAAIWAYTGLVELQVPVTRAAAGFTLLLGARFLHRRQREINLLAATLLLFLLWDPASLFDPSLQFSFLALALLFGLALPLVERSSGAYAAGLRGLPEVDRDLRLPPPVAQFRVELRLLAETVALVCRVPQSWALRGWYAVMAVLLWACSTMLVSACVQIGMTVPMLAYFHRLSLTAITANLIVTPLLTAAVPAGLAAVLTGWTPLLWLTTGLLRMSEWAVQWHQTGERLPRVPDVPWAAHVFLAAALMALCITLRMASRWRWLAAVGVVAALIVTLRGYPPLLVPGTLELTSLDVGQGDSLLLVTPEGRTMLIDGGGIPVFRGSAKPRLEIGEDVVSPYLWQRRLRTIDVLVATHGHEDHTGGLRALLANFRPRELWTGAYVPSPAWDAVLTEAKQRGVIVRNLRAGESPLLGKQRFEVLSPAPDYAPSDRPRNNDSLVLRTHYGRHTFLLTGDMERAVEERLVAEGKLGRVDVLKVPHHGSKTSTTDAFVEAVRPTLALISAGYGNIYRFPHREVLDRLESQRTMVLRTDQRGLVTVRSDGQRLAVE